MGFIANYMRNYASIALGRQPVRPLLFSYYITHRCRLKCRYCSDGDGHPFKDTLVDELNTSPAKELISLLRQTSDTLDITGGEPMVRNDLEEILAHAQSIGFRTVLNTKGIGIKDRQDILKLTDVLVLSLDSLRSDRLAGIIGETEVTAKTVLETVHWVIENRQTGKARIVIAAVITPEFPEDALAVFDFAMRNSLAFQFSPQIVGKTIHPQLVKNDLYERFMDKIITAKNNKTGILGVPHYLKGIRDLADFTCHPLLMPTIAPNGRMYYPCLEYGRAEIDLLSAGDYWQALDEGVKRFGPLPQCQGKCHIFCHMALSLLQRHPISAMKELRNWRGNHDFKN